MAIIIAINSIAGGSLALIACESEYGVHIEFSRNHCCSHSDSNTASTTFENHEHCHDFVIAGFSEEKFSDTHQSIKLKEPLCYTPIFAYPNVCKINVKQNEFFSYNTIIRPPPLKVFSANIPLLI